MTEHLMIGIWRAANVAPADVATGVVEAWAPEALTAEAVETCTVSVAEADQG